MYTLISQGISCCFLFHIRGEIFQTTWKRTNILGTPFLPFCLWFLSDNNQYFTFDNKGDAYGTLVSLSAKEVDSVQFNLTEIANDFQSLLSLTIV